ncbi:MAG: hypothetical protein RLY43_2047 [Bacteroidota bacterium]|jgi:ribosome-binding protein aMBF1 (putative translation factor)
MDYKQLIQELIQHYGSITRLARALNTNANYLKMYMLDEMQPNPDTIFKIGNLAIKLGLIK